MPDSDNLIVGREKLTGIFGYWPSFHDAEVIDVHLWRGDVNPHANAYTFPVLTVKMHVWELTRAVDGRGYLIRRHHTLTTLRFHDVFQFRMEGFNQQNAIFGLSIEWLERQEGVSPFFLVTFEPAFGMSASFECHQVEVLDASSCDDDGNPDG